MNTATDKKKKYKPYPEYKGSGVEWLGDIPKEWKVTKIKRLACQGYRTFTDGDWIESPYITNEGVRLIQTGNIGVGTYREQGYRYVSNETFNSLHCTEIKPGNILICRLAEPVGRACIAPDLGCRMITSVDVCILNPNEKCDPRFIVYFLSNPQYLSWLEAICRGGTRLRVSRSMLGAIEFLAPSRSEQQAIAVFLDRRTSEIDELIAKKERVIELLREKRTAVISHAVTKGLNPDAKMKDSGIDWLKKVPEHWEVKRLKRVSKKIQTGCTPPTTQEYYYEDGTISWYGPGNFGDDLILGEASKLINESAIKDGAARLFEAGSTMIVAIGATIGKVGYINKPASSNQQITAVAPNIAKVYGKFLAYQLKRLEQVLKGIAPNTTLPIMDQQKIGCLVIAIPQISEQQAITDFLDHETSKIDALIAKVIEAIEKLKEYRTALISAAVTGKIKVF